MRSVHIEQCTGGYIVTFPNNTKGVYTSLAEVIAQLQYIFENTLPIGLKKI